MAGETVNGLIKTQVLPVEGFKLGHFPDGAGLDSWELLESSSKALQSLKDAAQRLRTSNLPVAFPTETVYGLGADATRSAGVRGIYKAKGRPSDNPLIIHICDLAMLRNLLVTDQTNGNTHADPIPAVYRPLIDRFWPGPLTILLPNPEGSKLAPEVTAGLPSFGVRMPDSPLALSLIKLAGVPIAAPSANASTKPSPTTAQHVLHDLDGRIELILDGGSCDVGVESTIVDGLCDPPVVLRPGGISINSIRECPGWEGVKKAYKDEVESGSDAPRAPGMKYKHYSPKAKVILAENSANVVPKDMKDFELEIGHRKESSSSQNGSLQHKARNGADVRPPIIGIVRTRHWAPWGGWNESGWAHVVNLPLLEETYAGNLRIGELFNDEPKPLGNMIEISLGTDTKSIAHGLFSALRELDRRGAVTIYVEGIKDEYEVDGKGTGNEADIAAAIMNRLRKAATVIKS
jgi:L-threonylcarbamoyladenylate synthase